MPGATQKRYCVSTKLKIVSPPTQGPPSPPTWIAFLGFEVYLTIPPGIGIAKVYNSLAVHSHVYN